MLTYRLFQCLDAVQWWKRTDTLLVPDTTSAAKMVEGFTVFDALVR
ncbi:MAG: hypothetical protein AAGB04_11320 [Pseudomonadota bacterium]